MYGGYGGLGSSYGSSYGSYGGLGSSLGGYGGLGSSYGNRYGGYDSRVRRTTICTWVIIKKIQDKQRDRKLNNNSKTQTSQFSRYNKEDHKVFKW